MDLRQLAYTANPTVTILQLSKGHSLLYDSLQIRGSLRKLGLRARCTIGNQQPKPFGSAGTRRKTLTECLLASNYPVGRIRVGIVID